MRNIIGFGRVENKGRKETEKSDYQVPMRELETPELGGGGRYEVKNKRFG